VQISSILAQELEPLKAQIKVVRGKIETLEGEMHQVEAELEEFSTDKQRFDALRDVCNALDKLGELEASDLFWDGLSVGTDTSAHVERLRERTAAFDSEFQKVEEKRELVKKQIDEQFNELDYLQGEMVDAYAREERRKDEFLVEREISPVPEREPVMPWTGERESESRFRRALLLALLFCILCIYVIPLVKVPLPDLTKPIEIPERLASLVKKEIPKPPPKPPKKEKKPEDQEKQKETEEPKETKTAKKHTEPTTVEGKAARAKAESTGVLAFKSSFEDLIDETPVASARAGLETQSRATNSRMAAGQAYAQRSLVAMEGGSGGGGIAGIGNTGVSRNVGSGNGTGGGFGRGIAGGGGVGIARVSSALADLKAEEGRPVSDGAGPARTDEEIQIVFDRYKALLYRIYNKELRKNPTLKGKMLIRLTIEPSGEVSMCSVESTDLDSPELVAQIIERVKKFNFGPKDGVPKTTLLYPIDFLPAG